MPASHWPGDFLDTEDEGKLTATLTTKAELISIKSIALHHVRVPLIEPFRISNGAIAEKDAILVEVKTERA